MDDPWSTVPAADVRPGDRVLLDSGAELEVSRVEAPFLGIDEFIAFVEDTPERWFKQTVSASSEVRVRRTP